MGIRLFAIFDDVKSHKVSKNDSRKLQRQARWKAPNGYT